MLIDIAINSGGRVMITLPKKVYLRAMGKHWKIAYVSSVGKLIIIEQPGRQLVVYGKRYSKRAALHLIARWVRLKAHDFLQELVNECNRKVRVDYGELVTRSHESQWGSYSSSKTISLNYKLIFLPKALVKHIVFHELCHVNHLSHSKKFWQAVAKYDRNWKRNREELDYADSFIPDWATY